MSIKYSDLKIYKNRWITLLDSAGLETPVLKEQLEKENNSLDKLQDKKENKLINDENLKIENSNIGQQSKDESETETEIFKEKSREKIITESFLQNYIIHNSDILLVVVGILTYSEQKLLNKIRTKLKNGLLNKPNNTICIIHNLMTYTTVEQVESYIIGTLLKSATFELEKNIKINIKTESQDGVCYYEKDNDMNIYHLIFANDYFDAGKYYNGYTLQFIVNLFEGNIHLKNFDVLETIQERFTEFSKEVFENFPGKIEFYNSPILIKLNNPKELTLKQFFIDELGFSTMREKGFEPNYNYYKTTNQIVVKIEAPGNCNIKSNTIQRGEYVIIKIWGIKENEDNQKTIESNFNNGRTFLEEIKTVGECLHKKY